MSKRTRSVASNVQEPAKRQRTEDSQSRSFWDGVYGLLSWFTGNGRFWDTQIEDCVSMGTKKSSDKFDDKRCTRNPTFRKRITTHNNYRLTPAQRQMARPGDGRFHADKLLDPETGEWLPKRQFRNMSVRAALRPHDGFNVHPRCRQRDQYSFGYKLDGFIVDEDDEASEDHSDGEDWDQAGAESESESYSTDSDESDNESEYDYPEPARMSNPPNSSGELFPRYSNQSSSIRFEVADL